MIFCYPFQMISIVAWRVGVSIPVSLKEYHQSDCMVDPSSLLGRTVFYVCSFITLQNIYFGT